MILDILYIIFLLKIQIYIEKILIERLKAIATAEKVTYSALIRKILNEYVDRKESEKHDFDWVAHIKEIAGSYGPTNIADEHDDILYGDKHNV